VRCFFAEVALKVFGTIGSGVYEACPARTVDGNQWGEIGERESIN